jgi:hypothetical protein
MTAEVQVKVAPIARQGRIRTVLEMIKFTKPLF